MPIPKLIVLGNFLKQRPTGVQRYAIELTRVLAARNPGRVTLLAQPGVTIPSRLAEVPVHIGSCWPRLSRHLPGWAFLDAPLYLRLKGVGDTLVWNPSNIGAPHIPNQIITLHDLSFHHYPQFFSRVFRYKHQLSCALTLPWVRGLTTVSHTVKGEIEQKYPRLRGRINVVYNGVSEKFSPQSATHLAAVRLKYQLPDRFFLTVGSLDPRKNNKALIRAYVDSGLFAQTGIHLVLAGGKFSTFNEDPEFTELLQSPGIVHLGYVADEDLPSLYSSCHTFIFPSIYEGFGIPLIEALACGAPVICSDIPVFREIGKDLVTYFPINSPEALIASLRVAARRESHDDRVALLGATEFSWEQSAVAFESVLRGFRPVASPVPQTQN